MMKLKIENWSPSIFLLAVLTVAISKWGSISLSTSNDFNKADFLKSDKHFGHNKVKSKIRYVSNN